MDPPGQPALNGDPLVVARAVVHRATDPTTDKMIITVELNAIDGDLVHHPLLLVFSPLMGMHVGHDLVREARFSTP